MPTGATNLFGLTQFDGQTSFFNATSTILPETAGWGVLVGFGAFFAIVTSLLVWFDVKFAGHVLSSENFQVSR